MLGAPYVCIRSAVCSLVLFFYAMQCNECTPISPAEARLISKESQFTLTNDTEDKVNVIHRCNIAYVSICAFPIFQPF